MKKRTAIMIISALCAGLIALGAFGVTQNRNLSASLRVQRVYGERAVRSLAQSLSALDAALRRGSYTDDPTLYSRLAIDAAAQSAGALDAMSALPYATQELEKTARFINGAGDYALAMSTIAARGETPDAEARQNMATVESAIALLASGAAQIDAALNEGAVQMDEYGDGADAGSTDTVGYELRQLEEALPEYPELRYNGHYTSLPVQEGEGVTEQEARRSAALFLGIPEQRLSPEGKSVGALKCWEFSVSKEQDGEEQRIAVSVRDGAVAQWENTCRLDGGDVPEEEAGRSAELYLQQHGYSSMQEVDRSVEGGVCTFTFAAVQQGVLCLPDAVRVSVSLSTGEPCSYLAEEYLLNHREREELIAAVTPDQAAQSLSADLKPLASRLVITRLTAGGAEIFAHQIECQGREGDTVTVLVNAITGAQEKIIVSRGDET